MVLSTNELLRASFAVSLFVVPSFHLFRRFVVSSFCDRDRRPSEFQIFEFETRPAMIATFVMATRLTQSECVRDRGPTRQSIIWLRGPGPGIQG